MHLLAKIVVTKFGLILEVINMKSTVPLYKFSFGKLEISYCRWLWFCCNFSVRSPTARSQGSLCKLWHGSPWLYRRLSRRHERCFEYIYCFSHIPVGCSNLSSWFWCSVCVRELLTLRNCNPFQPSIKVKVKCTLAQALRLCTGRTAHMGSRGIALPFIDYGTRRGWGVSVTPRPFFTLGKEPMPIVQEAGWAPGPVWTGAENLAHTGIRSPDRPARSQSLYRLRYPTHNFL